MAISIAPNSKIKLLYVQGLDNRYLHTYYFASTAAQTQFFLAAAVFSFDDNSYTRNTKDFIRLQVADSALTVATMEQYFNCNYMMFQNTSFGSRWFYAFITSVEYVNNVTIEIHYEIDIMQTWFIGDNISQGKCFIERRTPTQSEDTLNKNYEPEPVVSENYKYTQIGNLDLYGEGKTVVITATGNEELLFTGDYVHGTFSGLNLQKQDCDNDTDAMLVGEKLTELTVNPDPDDPTPHKTDNVVSVVIFPKKMTEHLDDPSDPGQIVGALPHGTFDVIGWQDTYDGYAPKNKKVNSYPFKYLLLSDGNGTSIPLRREFFAHSTMQFEWYASAISTGELMCYPLNYKGMEKDYNDKIVIGNFPQCAFEIDSYRAWVAQGGMAILANNLTNTNLSLESAIAQTVTAGAVSIVAGTIRSPMAGAMAGINAVSGMATQMIAADTTREIAQNNADLQFDIAKAKPDVVCGSTSASIMNQSKALDVYVYEVGCTADEAKRIDNFFDVFGYTQNCIDTPVYNPASANNGKHMFVKTRAACCSGAAPAEILAGINKILDGGITFWKSGVTIGNYD